MKREDFLERIAMVYDKYMDRDEFPLDPTTLKINKSASGIWTEITCNSNGNTSNSFTNLEIVFYKTVFSKTQITFKRMSRVIAGNINGTYTFTSSHENLDPEKILNSEESFANICSILFDEYFESKIGAGGEIITTLCERVINIEENSTEKFYLYHPTIKYQESFQIYYTLHTNGYALIYALVSPYSSKKVGVREAVKITDETPLVLSRLRNVTKEDIEEIYYSYLDGFDEP